MYRPLLAALRLLTRLPVPEPATDGDPARLEADALFWFPVVGLLLGGLLWGGQAVLVQVHAPGLLQAALLLMAWVALTGALHLDGLADTADAWLGGLGDRERTLAIMKDPCAGPAGVVAVVLVLLLKFAALTTASGLFLLLAVFLGRVVLVLLFVTTPYVRPGGMGERLAASGRKALVGVAVTVAPLLLLWPVPTSLALILAGLVFVYQRQRLIRRLGGTTGDTAGAMVEWTESAVLAGLVLLL